MVILRSNSYSLLERVMESSHVFDELYTVTDVITLYDRRNNMWLISCIGEIVCEVNRRIKSCNNIRSKITHYLIKEIN